MSSLQLFPREQIVGVFKGFREGGLEFHADLVLPYQNDFQNRPMHGQFLLVQLESQDEAVLGRICALSAEGKLSSGTGEEFNLRAVRENRPVPEDLREEYLKYRVNIRVLGVLRTNGDRGLTFVASHRRLPHVGSQVAFPSDEVLQEIAGHNLDGAGIGYFALGEFVYSGDSKEIARLDWMQIKRPEVLVKFPVSNLVSRRSFVFARAGFGKSNLNKLLFSKLYEGEPTVEKRGGKRVPVGTVIFDPDGEYFWPDDKGRPGLCDVPWLQDRLVVFTSRTGPSPFYQSFVAGGIRLDIRRLRPADVIAIALSPEQQDQQNVRKLKGLDPSKWERLVALIDQNGHSTPLDDVKQILNLEAGQDAEALAARANMTTIVRMLHDRSSQVLDMLIDSLRRGRLCVIDVSQMRGSQAQVLSGLILRRIFDHNQEQFTAADPQTIPTIAVIEEAQAVLRESATASEPYIAWVKEGRKYDLGALLITQQPGSIPGEILSQGDNWFIFHLLSADDLVSVRRANAHFSEDLLSVLLNEPIPGQGVFWSSVGGKPYPISLRAMSFESMFKPLDPSYTEAAVRTFASGLVEGFTQSLSEAGAGGPAAAGDTELPDAETPLAEGLYDENVVDALATYERNAIQKLRDDSDMLSKLRSKDGAPWRAVQELLKEGLPANMHDRDKVAYGLVPRALTEVFGLQDSAWESYRLDRGERQVTYVRTKAQ